MLQMYVLDPWDPRVLWDQLDLRASRVFRVVLDYQDLPRTWDTRVLQDLLELLDPLDLRGQLDRLDLRVL